ncbi:MAG: EamA family transporter [Rhodospirillaceae bacterium]|nr:EamA family transporter [Rhodospirillaceae bacterium]
MVMLWGSFFPILERLLRSWDALSVTAARQVVGATALLLLLAATEGRRPVSVRAPAGRTLVLGAVGISLGSVLLSLGVLLSGGIMAALVAATSPLCAALVARLVFRMPLARGLVVGTILAVAGGALSAFAGRAGGPLRGFGLGEVLIVAANVVWCWFSIAAQRWMRGCSQLRIATLTTAAGALVLVVICLAAGVSGAWRLRIGLGADTLLLLVYAGALPIGLGNVLWHHGVSRIGIGIAAMYNNLVPVSAVLVSLAGGVAPTAGQLAGGAIIVAGVLYAQVVALRAERARRGWAGPPEATDGTA